MTVENSWKASKVFCVCLDVCVAVCWLSALQGVLAGRSADGGGSDRAAEGSDELGRMEEIESSRCGGEPEHGMPGTPRGLYV